MRYFLFEPQRAVIGVFAQGLDLPRMPFPEPRVDRAEFQIALALEVGYGANR